MLHDVCKALILILSKIFFRLSITGVENIPKKGGFILASNHVSYLDPLVVGASCRRKLGYMARHDLFLVPVLKDWLYAVGAFPVKRGTADFSAMKEAMRRVKEGKGLLLFPEGKRMEEGQIGEPSAGIGFLAAKLGVPVIPAFIKGSEKALPKHSKFIHPHKISVCFGTQIPIERGLPYQDIAENIMKKIRQLSCSN
ncbi:MAG: lysophospholipid acyltransferase family protein [Candidatus Omnitrophica bacterium]|nr:lysophospholipid acyltransferase family protein [Candidatus Omnitrophota bacterium]